MIVEVIGNIVQAFCNAWDDFFGYYFISQGLLAWLLMLTIVVITLRVLLFAVSFVFDWRN